MKKLITALAFTAILASPALAGPLPEEDLSEMAAGRQRLEAMEAPATRARFPELVARAEGSFDCWTLNPEAAAPDGRFAACRAEFMAVMRRLETLTQTANREDLALAE